MRLVLQYVQTDGYTYSCVRTLPVDYESAEALMLDLLAEARAAAAEGRGMKFLGQSFSTSHFCEQLDPEDNDLYEAIAEPGRFKAANVWWMEVQPDIYTLDEWFAAQGVGPAEKASA